MRHPHGLRAASGGEVTTAWNISAATYNGTPINFFNVASLSVLVRDVVFKPDGLKMYVATLGGLQGEYNLSTAWDISTASFVRSYATSTQDPSITGLQFKPDGTKMYALGTNNDRIYEYNLSTPWALNTVTFLQSFLVGGQDTNPTGLFFKPDGTKVYVTGSTGDSIYEYNLSTAWDISTASFLQSFSVATEEATPTGLFFKPDGTKVYVVGSGGDDINEYNLSTAWNISTASFVQTFSVAGQDVTPEGVFFKDDGTKMYMAGSSSASIYEYDLATAYNISTASYTAPTTNYFSVTAQETQPADVFFKPDGTKLYVTGSTGDDINEYNLSTAWNISTASFLQSFSIAGQESNPAGLFFKPDGTKLYVTGFDGDDINEYNLSTAWNISTASFVQSFSVAGQETTPNGLFFKPDGTKVYISGNTGDDINEYDLSTAWNISTASFVQTFSVAGQDTSPQGLFFKPDGTKVYVVGGTGDDINEYNLSTAWNISTASFVQTFSVAAQETDPLGMFFKDDGTKLYIIGNISDAIWSYDL